MKIVILKLKLKNLMSEDRDRTRIKLDVGNIKLQNGFIELIQKDILEDNEPFNIKNRRKSN